MGTYRTTNVTPSQYQRKMGYFFFISKASGIKYSCACSCFSCVCPSFVCFPEVCRGIRSGLKTQGRTCPAMKLASFSCEDLSRWLAGVICRYRWTLQQVQSFGIYSIADWVVGRQMRRVGVSTRVWKSFITQFCLKRRRTVSQSTHYAVHLDLWFTRISV